MIDPLPAGEFDTPSTGKRFVGVQMTVRNVGSAPYDDSLGNGSTLITKGDGQADSTIVSEGPCDSSFSSDVKIAPGDTRSGCIPFEVPSGARLRGFQFTPDSGFAGETGEWRVPSTGATSSVGAGSSSVGAGSSSSAAEGSGPVSYTNCAGSVSVKSDTTTCEFGNNTFYEYWTSGQSSSLSVYSPVTGRTYATECGSEGAEIVCRDDDGGEVKFPQSAVDAYSQSQADSYAADHDLGPDA